MAIDIVPVTALHSSVAATLAWRCKNQLYLTVLVKATFAFAVDAPMTRMKPQEIVRTEVHHGQDLARSVMLTSDLAPYLARADVLFTGSAHAPGGQPTRAVPLRLAVFSAKGPVLDKRLVARDPVGFQTLPVVYEHAVRGLDEENPLGATSEARILDPRELHRPGGFGPIGRVWPMRKRLLGTTPRAALEGPIATIPADFDWAYFQAAPPDQRVDYLAGNEWILMEGLHPSEPCLRTRLPGARGLARLYGLGGYGVEEGTPLELVADTLRIDGDAQCCTVVWRQNVPIAGDEALAAAYVVAGVEVAGEVLEWPDAPIAPAHRAVVPSSTRMPPDLHATIALSPEAEHAAAVRSELPFAPSVLPIDTTPPYDAGGPVVEPASFEPPRQLPEPPPLVSALVPPVDLRAASDAAAGVELDRVAMEAPSYRSIEATSEVTTPEKVVDLLWFEPRSMARIRKHAAWRDLLEELADEPIDSEIDDPDLHVDPAAAEERREVFQVLVKGERTSEGTLRSVFKGAVRSDGRFVAPLVLLEGELSLPFDEIAMLEAVVAVVGPLAGGDEGLNVAVEAGREFLSRRGALSSRVSATTLSAAIKVAYERGKRAVSMDEVEARIEQGLLDERRYQRRAVLGGKMLRGVLQMEGATELLPVYMPEELADVVPMYPRFGVRAIVDAVMAVDQRETQAMALRVLAVARMGEGEM